MLYTESHEWIRQKEKMATVGISSYAQKELGEIVSIELPKVGQFVKAKDEICVLESTKSAADVYAPASGKVTAVNEAIAKDPSLINKDAENSGWLFQMELTDPKELESLMSEKEYQALIR